MKTRKATAFDIMGVSASAAYSTLATCIAAQKPITEPAEAQSCAVELIGFTAVLQRLMDHDMLTKESPLDSDEIGGIKGMLEVVDVLARRLLEYESVENERLTHEFVARTMLQASAGMSEEVHHA